MVTYSDLDVMLSEFHIDLFRYDAYVRSVINKHLTAIDRSIVQKLAENDLQNLTKAQINRLSRDIKNAIKEEYERITTYLDESYNPLLDVVNRATASIYNQWVGFQMFDALPKYKVDAIKLDPIIQGAEASKWWSKQERDYQFKVERIIRNGKLSGQDSRQLISELRHANKTTKQQAESLYRTINASIASNAQERLFKENEDIIQYKQQLSTLDSRTTPICQHRDGMMWKLDGTPIGHNEEFIEPPLHFGCRSIVRVIIDPSKTGKRASEFGQVDSAVNYEDFLKSQDSEYIKGILGSKRAQLFEDGKLSLSQIIAGDNRYLTLKEIEAKYGF